MQLINGFYKRRSWRWLSVHVGN